MKRRSFFVAIPSIVAAKIIFQDSAAKAQQGCQQTQFGERCSAYIPYRRLGKIYASQRMPEWCWAASISMIFRFSRHPVSQWRIVRDAYGAVVNMPGNYPALLGSLDRVWRDDQGNEFTVTIDHLFAPDLGERALPSSGLVARLGSGSPILLGTIQHAVVLTAVRYIPTQFGPSVTAAWVMDPFPGKGLRQLSPDEMVPFPYGQLRMAATVEIDDS